ncbi:MAG: exodeoxyribonuclease VII small subunit [Clostridiales bacterium]|nr:exodeoxyribonuclease VII small subunit [Clostridiales bacterium]
MAEKEMKFEEALAALENSVSELRKDNVSLEDSIRIFEEGTKLYEKCESILNNLKQKIEVFEKE